MNKLFAILVLALVAGISFGASYNWQPLGVPEMAAHGGATHVAVFKYSDFVGSTSSNAGAFFTNSIMAKTYVEAVDARVVRPFDTAATNADRINSVRATVGDKGASNRYFTAVQFASDTNMVWVAYPNVDIVTVGTNNPAEAPPASITRLAAKYYDVSTNIIFLFQPCDPGFEALSSNHVGEVRFYFKLTQPERQ